MEKLKCHLFICTNERPEGKASCSRAGSQQLRDKVKKICKERGFQDLRVNNAGCLGHCEEGIVAVAYPEGQWFSHLNSNDEAKLIEYVEAKLGKPN